MTAISFKLKAFHIVCYVHCVNHNGQIVAPFAKRSWMHCYSYYHKTGDSLLTYSILLKALYLNSFHGSLNIPNVTIPAVINFFMRTIIIGFHLKQIERLTWCHMPLLAVIFF